MKVKGLNGRTYNWKLRQHKRERSKPHEAAHEIIVEFYPLELIYEDVSLPGSNKLYADFILPRSRIMVEVHGEQHYEFNAHFHKNMNGFLNSCKRDQNKQQWAQINDFTYIELDDRNRDEWREQFISV